MSQRLEALHRLWDELQATTKEKAQQLSAARSSDLRSKTQADLNKWISAMEDQLRSDSPGKDLTSVNRMLAKLKARERGVDWECWGANLNPESQFLSAGLAFIVQKCLLCGG